MLATASVDLEKDVSGVVELDAVTANTINLRSWVSVGVKLCEVCPATTVQPVGSEVVGASTAVVQAYHAFT